LKPANVKVRADDTVKVFDFGLAKLAAPDASGPGAGDGVSKSPTLTTPAATLAGMILGTAGYMAPEQARGKAVDKRADIWAFGVVLYEMVTGQRLFEGETVSDTLTAVLTREPEWDRVPLKVQRLLRRCLEKDPKRRLRDIGDAMALLDESHAAPQSPPRRSWLAVSLGALAAASTLTAAALAVVHFRDQPPPGHPVQFEIPPPGKTVFGNALSVSPDGRQIAFIAQRQIWVRALDSTQPRLLADTDGAATALVWSPDSRFLLFSNMLEVKKIDVFGGPPQTLCGSCPHVRGGAWNREGVVLLANAGGIMRTTDTGGVPTPVVSVNSVQGNLYFLRDDRHFLYLWQFAIVLTSARSSGGVQ
jgi:eukaryotic-like serine/threonine-protein kinase